MSAALFAAAVVTLDATRSLSADQLSLKEVMRRVRDYVSSYGERASIVVCTERYSQESSDSGKRAATRMLVSDFAIVKADAIRGWLGFRDVIEVDGRAVADRDDRLARVLIASQGQYDEARRLSDESARFNIGPIDRNFNVPTTALFYFTPDNVDRFKYSARRVLDDGTWEIAFKEKGRPTMIRTPDGEPVYSSGTIWVVPADGTIVRTLLKAEFAIPRGRLPYGGTASVDVTYRRVDTLGMWLPAVMDESIEGYRSGTSSSVSGRAEYSDYRVFTTSVRIK